MEPQGKLGVARAVPPALRRILEAAVTLGGLVVLTFVLLKLLPGSPFDDEIALHPSVRDRLEQSWRLHASWPRQFASYVESLAHGDLGSSMIDGRAVASVLSDGLRETLLLNSFALLLTFALGLAMAMGIAWRPRRRLARTADALTIALISLPSLFLGPLLILIFAMRLDWLPAAFLDSPAHYVLPVITLALRPAAGLARLLAGALLEAGRADYMRTAKAKGLSEARALFRHALRNSLVPGIAYVGPLVVGMLSGSFLVEILFAVRGLGGAFVEAIGHRDLPVVLGLTLFYGALLVAVSLVFDLVMKWADPRLRGAG